MSDIKGKNTLHSLIKSMCHCNVPSPQTRHHGHTVRHLLVVFGLFVCGAGVSHRGPYTLAQTLPGTALSNRSGAPFKVKSVKVLVNSAKPGTNRQ